MSGSYIPQPWNASDPVIVTSAMQAAVEALELDQIKLSDNDNDNVIFVQGLANRIEVSSPTIGTKQLAYTSDITGGGDFVSGTFGFETYFGGGAAPTGLDITKIYYEAGKSWYWDLSNSVWQAVWYSDGLIYGWNFFFGEYSVLTLTECRSEFVSANVSQSFTAPQQAQARTNIGALAASVTKAELNTAVSDGDVVYVVHTVNGAASAPPLSLTGTWFTGGTSTTTKPQFLIEPTGTTSTGWATTGTAIGANAASGFTGRLIDLQIAGSSIINASASALNAFPNATSAERVAITKDGTFSYVTASFFTGNTGGSAFGFTGNNRAMNSTGVVLLLNDALSWQNSTTIGTRDFSISRNAAGVGQIGNSTTNNALGSLLLANLTASALIGLGAYTVATLPSASANAGRIAQATDSSVTTNGTAVSGGGANRVMVFSNGTNWDVVVA